MLDSYCRNLMQLRVHLTIVPRSEQIAANININEKSPSDDAVKGTKIFPLKYVELALNISKTFILNI